MLKDLLTEQALRIGIAIDPEQAERFERYHAMLTEANARINLTRVPEDIREAVDRNYLDCIAILSGELSRPRSAIDVGSGAGFPGIPLSIMMPETRWTLLDAQGRRVEFLRSVIDALKLNAEAVHLRAEDAARRPGLREGFDLAVARAVAPMNVLCEYLLPFVRPGGIALAMKGPGLDRELAEAGYAIALLGGRPGAVSALTIPGRDWDHRAVRIDKIGPTPGRYPRRSGIPEKRPLTGRTPITESEVQP